jgi:hypothetical protein
MSLQVEETFVGSEGHFDGSKSVECHAGVDVTGKLNGGG